jgi:hypothetical protein
MATNSGLQLSYELEIDHITCEISRGEEAQDIGGQGNEGAHGRGEEDHDDGYLENG